MPVNAQDTYVVVQSATRDDLKMKWSNICKAIRDKKKAKKKTIKGGYSG
jgi:hypothetical protein